MSDYAWGAVAVMIFVVGLFALIGWVAWLDTPRSGRKVTDTSPGCGGRHCSGEDA
jgi:hypothetical protein